MASPLGFLSRFARLARLVALAPVAAFVPACTSDDGGAANDAGPDGIGIPPGLDGSGGDRDDAASPGVSTTFRLANVSPDLGAFDVCYRLASTTSWMGPVFAPSAPIDAGAVDAAGDALADAAAADAATDASPDAAPLPAGVAFATMSRYVTVDDSGTFDVALVAPGATSCTHPRALAHVTLAPGRHATVVVMGLARADAGSDAALAITAFADDLTVTPRARARFIHGALGGRAPAIGPVSIDAVTPSVVPLAAELLPGHASTASASPPIIDARGYVEVDPVAAAALRVSPLADGGAPRLTDPFDLQMTASSIHTGVLFDDGADVAILWCSDERGGGQVTQCSVKRAR